MTEPYHKACLDRTSIQHQSNYINIKLFNHKRVISTGKRTTNMILLIPLEFLWMCEILRVTKPWSMTQDRILFVSAILLNCSNSEKNIRQRNIFICLFWSNLNHYRREHAKVTCYYLCILPPSNEKPFHLISFQALLNYLGPRI